MDDEKKTGTTNRPDDGRRTDEEMQQDGRVFAEKNPCRGGLHGLDATRAGDKHTVGRFRKQEEMLAAGRRSD